MKNLSALIFTDLDGTFLDNNNFSFGKNFDVAQNLIASGHFVIFNSSKTFVEIDKLFNHHQIKFPIICETGGGIYIPYELSDDHEPFNNSYNTIYEATKISVIKDQITDICDDFKDEMKFFNDLIHDDKIKLSGLDSDGVILASQRVFSTLFVWSSSEARLMELSNILKKINIRIIKGARFFHLCSNFDKGTAMQKTINKFKDTHADRDFVTVALGDSSNDYEMLKIADYPCVVKSHGNKNLHYSALPEKTIFSSISAPNGWSECIEKVLSKLGAS